MAETRTNFALASISSRLIALIVDNVILAIVGALLLGVGRETGGGLTFLIGLIYHWYFLSRRDGQTLGKQMMNIRVIKTDGSGLTDTDAALRYVGYYINTFVFLIGWLWALFDANRQGWHDKIVQTYVVEA